MYKFNKYILVSILVVLGACSPKKKDTSPAPFLTAAEAVRLNQAVYKPGLTAAIDSFATGFEALFVPEAVEGNFAVITRKKETEQYALVIRGSLVEFSKAGFQNFFLQDFNIFTIKPWPYADTVKEAYISNGAWTGFQNLLQLRDKNTGLSLKDFLEKKMPANASLVVTGHSLGGNLAYPMAGYLKKELKAPVQKQLQLITFGAPAAGNAAFVKDMDEKFPAAERYVTNNDIAPVFPDMRQVRQLAVILGLDKLLNLDSFSIAGMRPGIKSGDLLDLARELLETTNVINKTNQYVQSERHLRLLQVPAASINDTSLSPDALFNRAYEYHKVDRYAELLKAGATR